MEISPNQDLDCVNYITEDDVKVIVRRYGYSNNEVVIDNYKTHNASSKMLGFLSDYWKLKVHVTLENGRKEVLCFFIKAVSKSNAAKANMVREMRLFNKETFFYSVLKDRMEVRGLKPWSARFVTALDEAMVFEDLNALQYKPRDKFKRFDMQHTLRALETLARFHGSSIIFEETKSKLLGRPYAIHEEYEQFLDKGGYREDDTWFNQCTKGVLDAVKTFSKYGTDKKTIENIESVWSDIWNSSLSLCNFSSRYRNVICHRDLWNNNILFHYKKVDECLIPDDCVMVDFQAVRCQPPAGDVMLLLYCNLDPKFREEHMTLFLDHYYNELKLLLSKHNIALEEIITKSEFTISAEEQRLWGLIVCACLIPQFWIDDDLTTEIFTDTAQFDEILSKDKGAFIKKMMEINADYKEKVMGIFDEIVERYCFRNSGNGDVK